MFPVTSFFAGLFALYFLSLTLAVVRLRRSNKVALGAGGVNELEGAIRAHGNFAEYVPIGLILMGLLESDGAHPALVAVLGVMLALGRVLHARALSQSNLKFRVRGMLITYWTLVALAVLDMGFAVRTWIGS
jgi:uncharacterized protein